MKRLIIFLMLIGTSANAQEVITSFNDTGKVVLNEELRKTRSTSQLNQSTISTLQTDVAALEARFPVSIADGGTGQITAQAAIDALLPSQTSNSGEFLTTNGTTSSWGSVTTTGYKVGTISEDSSQASGDVSVTGVGFTPKLVMVYTGSVSSASASSYTTIGTSDGTTHKASKTDNSAVDYLWEISPNVTYYGQRAIIKTFDSDGFTYTRTRFGGGANQINITLVYVAYR